MRVPREAQLLAINLHLIRSRHCKTSTGRTDGYGHEGSPRTHCHARTCLHQKKEEINNVVVDVRVRNSFADQHSIIMIQTRSQRLQCRVSSISRNSMKYIIYTIISCTSLKDGPMVGHLGTKCAPFQGQTIGSSRRLVPTTYFTLLYSIGMNATSSLIIR